MSRRVWIHVTRQPSPDDGVVVGGNIANRAVGEVFAGWGFGGRVELVGERVEVRERGERPARHDHPRRSQLGEHGGGTLERVQVIGERAGVGARDGEPEVLEGPAGGDGIATGDIDRLHPEVADRGELLENRQLEAERLGPAQPDFVGPRDILFWDGASMHTVFRSPGPWHGRADLNADGVVAWEGFGGLPGSASGTADAEIFVYRPELRQIVQLTDDDELDIWPTVSDDGRVVWMGTGNYPGAPGGRLDREIFIATPNADADSDGVPDQADNCPLRANADQRDRGRVGSLLPDGIGDACQCGDVSNNGLVSNRDVSAFRDALAAGQVGSLAAPQKCRVNGALAPCSIADLAILRRALEAAGPLEPGIEQLCDAALQF